MDLEPIGQSHMVLIFGKNHLTANRHFKFTAIIGILEIDRAKIGNSYYFHLRSISISIGEFYLKFLLA